MNPTLVITGMVGLLALSKKFVDFLRYVTNLPATKSSVLTQLGAWVAGIGAVFLYCATQFSTRLVIDGISGDTMNGWTKLLVGLTIGSLAAITSDVIKAVDNTDSAAVPPLLKNAPPPSS